MIPGIAETWSMIERWSMEYGLMLPLHVWLVFLRKRQNLALLSCGSEEAAELG